MPARTLLALAALLLAAGCTGAELAPADLYGTWELVVEHSDEDNLHAPGEELQLAPGSRAFFRGEGITERQVGFTAFRGERLFPAPGKSEEPLLLQIEGEPEILIVEMPNRNTLTLEPNGVYGSWLTYRRSR